MNVWWAALANVEAPEDQFEQDKAAALAANNAECQAAIDAMRRTAEAEMLKLLDDMPVSGMARA